MPAFKHIQPSCSLQICVLMHASTPQSLSEDVSKNMSPLHLTEYAFQEQLRNSCSVRGKKNMGDKAKQRIEMGHFVFANKPILGTTHVSEMILRSSYSVSHLSSSNPTR